MDPIFGRTRSVVAWLEPNHERLRSLQGSVIGWLNGDAVYSVGGSHVGFFTDGTFRDLSGRVVAFVRAARPGVAMPGLGGVPGRPDLSGVPGKPGFSGRRGRPGNVSGWSHTSFNEFVR